MPAQTTGRDVKKVMKKNANIELLRIISMLMVTMLHALGKSGLLVDISQLGSAGAAGINPANAMAAWVLEALSISAVNIFMLISGYFLINSEFKIKRLAEIVLQILVYTAGSFGAGLLLGVIDKRDVSIYSLLNNFMPVHMEVYWFMTAYTVIYICLPLISKGINAMNEKQHRLMLILLLVYECVIKSLLPFRLTSDTKGYSFFWYLIVFTAGAYFRKYGFRLLNSRGKGLALYFGAAACVLTESFAIRFVITRFGKLEELGMMAALEYNNIFVFLEAVGIFAAFVNAKPMRESIGKVICFLSPMALGVYLLQENFTFRYEWQKWFALESSLTQPLYIMLLKVIGAVAAMYALGTAVDFVRRVYFEALMNPS